jgi:hypothetical protein
MDLESTLALPTLPGGLVALTRVVEKAAGRRHEHPSRPVRRIHQFHLRRIESALGDIPLLPGLLASDFRLRSRSVGSLCLPENPGKTEQKNQNGGR